METPISDALRRVVVHVVRVATRLTREELAGAVLFGRKATRRTPTRCVPRIDLHRLNVVLGGFALNVLEKPPERPHVLPAGVRQAVADMRQILESDRSTVVLAGFGEQVVRHTVQHVFEAIVLGATDGLDRLVGVARAVLLHRRATAFVFASPVVELIAVLKYAGGSDPEVPNAEIDTEDRSMLGAAVSRFVSRTAGARLILPHGGMQVPLAVSALQGRHTELPLVGQVLRRWFARVVGENVVTLDAAVRRRERYAVPRKGSRSLVVDHRVGGKVWSRCSLAALQSSDAGRDRFDGPADSLLHEGRRQVGFLAESVVQRAFGLRLGGFVILASSLTPGKVRQPAVDR